MSNSDAGAAVLDAPKNGQAGDAAELEPLSFGALKAEFRGGAVGLAAYAPGTFIVRQLEASGENRPRYTAIDGDGQRARVDSKTAAILKAGLARGRPVLLRLRMDGETLVIE